MTPIVEQWMITIVEQRMITIVEQWMITIVEQQITTKEKVNKKGFSTHSCLEINSTNVVWTDHTFEYTFGMKQKFQKYLKRVVDFC